MSTKDKGPAFPFLEVDHDGAPCHQDPGLSLRDYFAIHTEEPKLTHRQAELLIGDFTGKAHAACGATSWEYNLWLEDAKATFRYLKADAMLKARETQC